MASILHFGQRTRRLVVLILIVQFIGCGTIFYPERRGQPAGRLDPVVVALDAVGLLLFFIPGVIAFAVDFNNGTIYLPPDGYGDAKPVHHGWSPVRTASARPSSEEIELVIRQRTGKVIELQPGHYRVGKLKSADELADLNFDQLELAAACEAAHVRFRCQSE
jgi:hypothetical protein